VSSAARQKRCWNESYVSDGKGVGKMSQNCLKNLRVIRTEVVGKRGFEIYSIAKVKYPTKLCQEEKNSFGRGFA
jgi:hypothetical protein